MHDPDVMAAPASPTTGRDLVRLAALGAVVLFWLLPWPEVEIADPGDGSGVLYAHLRGAERTGAPGALSLLAVWALSVGALTRLGLAGLRRAGAWADALVGAGACLLLFLDHPWMAAGSLREAWAAVFVPLTLLAALDASVAKGEGVPPTGLLTLRALAGAIAAAAFATRLAWIPAGIAAWLTLSPLLWMRVRRPRAGRRVLELLLLLGICIHPLSALAQEHVVGAMTYVGSSVNLPFVLWAMAAALVAVTAVEAALRPEGEPPGPSPTA